MNSLLIDQPVVNDRQTSSFPIPRTSLPLITACTRSRPQCDAVQCTLGYVTNDATMVGFPFDDVCQEMEA